MFLKSFFGSFWENSIFQFSVVNYILSFSEITEILTNGWDDKNFLSYLQIPFKSPFWLKEDILPKIWDNTVVWTFGDLQSDWTMCNLPISNFCFYFHIVTNFTFILILQDDTKFCSFSSFGPPEAKIQGLTSSFR